MDAPLGLRGRDALHPVAPGLEAEQAPGVVPGDAEGHLLVAAHLAGAAAHELDLEPGAVAEAAVHPEEIRREEGRLVAAGPRPDLDDHAPPLIRWVSDEGQLDLLVEGALLVVEARELLTGQGRQLLVRPFPEDGLSLRPRAAHARQLREHPVGRLQRAPLPQEPRQLLPVRRDLGVTEQAGDLLVPIGALLQLRHQGGVELQGSRPGGW